MENPTGIEEKDKNIGMAVFSYFVFFLPLLTEAKDDSFVKFHVKQGTVLFITVLVTGVVGNVISKIPFFGNYLFWVINLGLIVIWIIGILNALNGKEEPLPIIGKYAEMLKF
jgi:uncharacterized membrane protein